MINDQTNFIAFGKWFIVGSLLAFTYLYGILEIIRFIKQRFKDND